MHSGAPESASDAFACVSATPVALVVWLSSEFPSATMRMSTVFAGTDVGWYLRHLGSWALQGCLRVLGATTSCLPIKQSVALFGQLFKHLILLCNAIRN